MPVRKYRSVAELGPPPASDSPAENLRAAFDLMELCWRLHPWQVPRGVQRRRTVDAPLEPAAPHGTAG